MEVQKGTADNTIKPMSRDDLEAVAALFASEVNRLKEIIESMKRQAYGRKSEKFDPNQLNIFQLLGLKDSTVVVEDNDSQAHDAEPVKKRGRKKGARIFSGIPVKTVDIYPDSITCPRCGRTMTEIRPVVTNELVYQPAKLFIRRTVKHQLACFSCFHLFDEPNNMPLKVYGSDEPMPVTLFPRTAATPEFVAHTAYDLIKKCVPLYRQEKTYKDMGYTISRTLLCQWLFRSMDEYLHFIVDRMRRDFITLKLVHLDETELEVLEEIKRGFRSSDSYVWIGMSGEKEDMQMAVYVYGPGRGKDELNKLLVVDGKHFTGTSMTDGFNVYDKYPYFSGHAECMAHFRRKIDDAMKVQNSLYREFHSKSITSERRKQILDDNPVFREEVWLLEKIGELAKWEGQLRDENAEPDKIKNLRETKELPILDKIHAKLMELEGNFMPSGKFSIAINYGINQWDKLTYYISHPECPMTNNLIEREGVKPFVMTRKNVLFSNSIEGAQSMMNWFSLFTSAKMNNLDVEGYISYALSELSTHKMTDETIERLLPYSNKLPDSLKISDNRQD